MRAVVVQSQVQIEFIDHATETAQASPGSSKVAARSSMSETLTDTYSGSWRPRERVSRRRSEFSAALVVALASVCLPASAADNEAAQDKRGTFSFVFENEFFYGSDRNYTNGVRSPGSPRGTRLRTGRSRPPASSLCSRSKARFAPAMRSGRTCIRHRTSRIPTHLRMRGPMPAGSTARSRSSPRPARGSTSSTFLWASSAPHRSRARRRRSSTRRSAAMRREAGRRS